jgi:hypothetical protein
MARRSNVHVSGASASIATIEGGNGAPVKCARERRERVYRDD